PLDRAGAEFRLASRRRRTGRPVSPIHQLMNELRRAQVRVWAEGDHLRYQAPRGALTPALLSKLRSQKGDVIAFIRQAQDGADVLPLGPMPHDVEPQVSLAQHRLWMLDQMHGPNATYNISLVLHLRGELDDAALQRAFAAILL